MASNPPCLAINFLTSYLHPGSTVRTGLGLFVRTGTSGRCRGSDAAATTTTDAWASARWHCCRCRLPTCRRFRFGASRHLRRRLSWRTVEQLVQLRNGVLVSLRRKYHFFLAERLFTNSLEILHPCYSQKRLSVPPLAFPLSPAAP